MHIAMCDSGVTFCPAALRNSCGEKCVFDSYSEAEGEEGQGALHVSMRVPVAKNVVFLEVGVGAGAVAVVV